MDLPLDIIKLIFGRLDISDVKNYLCTSKCAMRMLKGFLIHQPVRINPRFKSTELYSCLTSIEIGWVPERYPPNLQQLIYKSYTNSPIKYIPSTVTHLTLDHYFNRQLNNSIPPTIIHLTFGQWFNQPIRGEIPSGVRTLCFGDNFNQSIKKAIPSGILKLKFGKCFNMPLKNNIPFGIRKLILGAGIDQCLKGVIPTSVRKLNIGCDISEILDEIPSGVTHLTLIHTYDQSINIPDSITHLILTLSYEVTVLPISPNIRHLSLFGHFRQHIEFFIPRNLCSLTFDYLFDYSFNGRGLPYLRKLTFSTNFDQPLYNLPPSLELLTLPRTYKHTLSIPPQCTVQYI